jgi:hypothetical protein
VVCCGQASLVGLVEVDVLCGMFLKCDLRGQCGCVFNVCLTGRKRFTEFAFVIRRVQFDNVNRS